MAGSAANEAHGATRSVVVGSLWGARWVVLAAAVVAGAGGFLVSSLQSPEYTAESRMVLSASQNFDPLGGSSFGEPTRFVANQVSILGTLPVLQDALAILDDDTTVEELADSLDVSASSSSDVIVVSASAGTAQGASDRADAVVAAYRAYSADRVSSEAADAAAATTDPAIADQIQTQAAVYGDGVAVVEEALVPAAPSSPRPLRDAVVLAVVAALVAAGLALWRRTPTAPGTHPGVERSGVRSLGTVPVRSSRRGAADAPDVRMADAATALVALAYVTEGSTAPVLLTGLSEQSGTAAAGHALAVAAAAQGRRVLIVDAGAGAPGLVERLGVTRPSLPLTRMAAPIEDAALDQVLIPVTSPGRGEIEVCLLRPAGDVRPPADNEIATALGIVGSTFDLVLLAAAPVSEDAEAFALLRHAGAVVVVVDVREDGGDFPALHDRLAAAHRDLSGVILTEPVRVRKATPAKVSSPRRAASPTGSATPSVQKRALTPTEQ